MYLTLYQEDCCSERCSKSDSSRMDSPEPPVQHWTTKSTHALQDTQLRVDINHSRIKLSFDTCMNSQDYHYVFVMVPFYLQILR